MNLIKKTLLAIVAFAGLSASAAVKPIVIASPDDYQVIALSPNGKWATGVYVDYAMQSFGFVWNLESGSSKLLSTTYESYGSAVTNDGVVIGNYVYKAPNSSAMVNLPGYYKDGEWHPVEIPGGASDGGQGVGCTADGHYMCGALYVNNDYHPFVWDLWEGGKIVQQLDITNPNGGMQDGVAYCITPDGKTAGGWSWNHNRACTLWDVDANTKRYIGLSGDAYQNPWASVDKFSPDGKKALFGGWWDPKATDTDPFEYAIRLYDMKTGELTYIPNMYSGATCSLFGISNTGVLVGATGDYDNGRAIIYHTNSANYDEEDDVFKAGRGEYLDAWLVKQGADLSGLHIWDDSDEETTDEMTGTTTNGFVRFFRGQDVSADGNIISALYYANVGGYAVMRSAIIMLNQDASHAAPQDMELKQMSGINCVKVSWAKALRATEGVLGFAIYRDGNKIAQVNDKTTYYYDENVAPGEHKYYVATVYADEETPAPAFNIFVKTQETQRPINIYTRQKGINSIYAEWERPASNLITKNWYDPSNVKIEGFGLGQTNMDIEMGIGFDANEMALYKNSKIAKINFYPMSHVDKLTLNIYKYNTFRRLERIYSQPVTQNLNYKERNTIVLDTPVELPAGSDIVVAFSAQNREANTNILGMDDGRATAGYSDLIRFADENDFYSLYDLTYGQGYPQYMSLLIDVILQPEGKDLAMDEIEDYTVTMDGVEVATTDELSYTIKGATLLTNGENKTIGVTANYKNGSSSEATVKEQKVYANFKGASNVKVEANSEQSVLVTWDEPLDADNAILTYSGDTPGTDTEWGVTGPSENNYGFMASVVYPSSTIKGYDGYLAKSARFYPTAEAIFTFYLLEDGKVVAEQEVDKPILNAWNTVQFDKPVALKTKSNYRLVLDIYDADPNKVPLAQDNRTPYAGVSDVYSVSPDIEGAEWESATYVGIRGNWMIGMNIEDANPQVADVSGYDVYLTELNGTSVKKRNTDGQVQGNSYTYNYGKDVNGANGRVRVATFYNGRSTVAVAGSQQSFSLVVDGIDQITIQGNVKSYTIYDAAGAKVGAAEGRNINTAGLQKGVYTVKINTLNGKQVVRTFSLDN